jgi:uncharacterized protein
MKTEAEVIHILEQEVKDVLSGEGTGHDWFHIERVRRIALQIAQQEEGANLHIIEIAALLHDIADHKFHNGDETIGAQRTKEILSSIGLEDGLISKVVSIVEEISFKGSGVPTPMTSLEGQVVQDADRLDAMGAIGIARTFAYGGSKNRPIYDPNIKPVCHSSFAAYKTSTAPTINHFYEKLLLLKDLMNTKEGKRIAMQRHQFMEEFLERFYQEWDGRDTGL